MNINYYILRRVVMYSREIVKSRGLGLGFFYLYGDF